MTFSASDAAPRQGGLTLAARGAVGLVVLDRKEALNALTTAMRRELPAALERWARDPQIYAVVIASAHPGLFCAGGDIRETAARGPEMAASAAADIAEDYRQYWQLECFSKPTVSLIDGLVMGAGVGLSIYGTHRVAAERYQFAMPEVRIGFFPNCGASWFLGRLPRQVGIYLGLTATRIGRADAYHLGLATHCVPATAFERITEALAEAEPVDELLDRLHVDPGPPLLAPYRDVIERCFSAPTVAGILARLEAERGEQRSWALEAREAISQGSPRALEVGLRLMRACAGLDPRAALEMEWRATPAILAAPDFREGVRARLLDRSRPPVWQPSRLEDLTEADLAACLPPSRPGDLSLPERPRAPAAIES